MENVMEIFWKSHVYIAFNKISFNLDLFWIYVKVNF